MVRIIGLDKKLSPVQTQYKNTELNDCLKLRKLFVAKGYRTNH